MIIERFDHVVLTVRDLDTSAEFYVRTLGMERRDLGDGRVALHFGNQKINLHRAGLEHPPFAARPTPGSADLCFVTRTSPGEAAAFLRRAGVDILEGPRRKIGAVGPIDSLYFRDPDGNLIEVASYPDAPR